jgi:hypothetical protein
VSARYRVGTVGGRTCSNLNQVVKRRGVRDNYHAAARKPWPEAGAGLLVQFEIFHIAGVIVNMPFLEQAVELKSVKTQQ